jgi:hypothetical protein
MGAREHAANRVRGNMNIAMFGTGSLRASGTAALMNPFRFATKYQDEETGLL